MTYGIYVMVEVEVDDEYVDLDDPTGLTEEGWDLLTAALRNQGGFNVTDAVLKEDQ